MYVKTIDSHRIKTLLDARDLLMKIKRSLSDQVRSLLHPFGIRLFSRSGMKIFAEAAHQAAQNDTLICKSQDFI